MRCSIENCSRPVMYKARGICQVHYFRFMRNGHYELVRAPRVQFRRVNAVGYVQVYDKGHPLAMVDGFVYEHRAVVYARYGDDLPPCELCGKAINWATCHVDHRDDSVDNNESSNLRPLCAGCNTSRTPRSRNSTHPR